MDLALNPLGELRRPRSHEVERMIQELYQRNDYDRDEMGKLEWLCLSLVSVLDRSRYTRVLQEEMVIRPAFFIEMLEWLYRPKEVDGSTNMPRGAEEDKRSPGMAQRAHDLLKDWSSIPGIAEDGSLDGNILQAWIDEARALAIHKFRLEVADMHIGKLLAHYPGSHTGQKPPDEVCRVIDRINTKSIRSGFYGGVFEKQSASSRGPFDGGDRERRIAAAYKRIAESLLLRWPVTASIFESLATSYLHEAVRQDEEAQKDSLDN